MRTTEIKPAAPEVKSAARILDLLELLGVAREPVRLSEIARQMDMPKSSTAALLATLEGRGYVESGADGITLAERYREGDWVLGEYGQLLRAARPVMQAVARQTGESAFLAIPTRDWMVQYIEKVVSDNPLRYDIALPTVRPAHATSVGRVLLAECPDDLLRHYFRSDRIVRLTAKTEIDPDVLFEAIRTIRAVSHALISDSSVLGSSGVAAPIRDAAGSVLASLCVIAPTARFDAAQSSIVEAVGKAAAQVGMTLPRPPAAGTKSNPRLARLWKP